ncbi:MAG: hypothetical protein HC936_18290, partial [Leptolyngbyaceae cyanobacterium SU_3_3]|nr:hypothetical protein [Leptolyngbyaceae cyanobacterium SU_3_3]
PLTGTPILSPLATLDPTTASYPNSPSSLSRIGAKTPPPARAEWRSQPPIIEAQGWIKTAEGIILVAQAPEVTPTPRSIVPPCPASKLQPSGVL